MIYIIACVWSWYKSALLGFHNIDTTDVQSAEVMYFQNYLFLRCFFANNFQQARGCAVRLTLADSNEIETYQFLLDDGVLPCFRTDFRLDAAVYNEVVAIIDIEEDGVLGSGNITVVPVNVTTEEMYTEITGCPTGIKLIQCHVIATPFVCM
jgi:hypothetical protein